MTHVGGAAAVRPGPASADEPDPLTPTVFHEPWWLDIVTRRRWQATEVREDGRVVGRMPYHLTHRLGGPAIGMPPLTHFLGPAIDAGGGSDQRRWLRRLDITRELIRALPPRARFRQKFHRGIGDVVAFQAERFDTAVQFTFEIAPAADAVLWAAMRDKHRNVIRKARKLFTVQAMEDCEEFTHFYLANLHRRRAVSWTSPAVMAELLPASLDRGCGQLLGLRDGEGALAAAIFCTRDHRTCYYTLSTRSPAAGNGGVTLLIWEAIRGAARDGLLFDFDGLSTEGSIWVYAGFGGRTSPRFISSRTPASALARLARRALGLRLNPFGS